MTKSDSAIKTSKIDTINELNLSNVLENSLNEIYIFDTATLKFIQVNKGARKNLGYGMDELLAMTPVDIKPEHTNETFNQVIKTLALDEKQKIQFNTLHRRKDGTEYPTEVHLQKMHFDQRSVYVAIIIDITERVQRKLDLVQAHAFLDSAPDATVVVDNLGNIKVTNHRVVELLGYSASELKLMNVDDLVPQPYRSAHAAHRDTFSSNPIARGMGTGLDLSAVTKDGRNLPIEISLSPIDTADGMMVAAAIRDISARKAFEEELRLAKQQAEDATQEKSRFLAAASHDLRQPLQALRLYLSTLSVQLDQPKQIELSEKMNLSLDSMGGLLDALLDICTLESGSITPHKVEVPLVDFLKKMEACNSEQIAAKGLTFTCSPVTCVVKTDPALLARIVENYLTNAIRYTCAGTISIDCQLHDEHVCIAVSDTGQGIPEHELEGIFNDYHQLNNPVRDRTKGLGLGLSIVKKIAGILDHNTAVSSVVGKGSTFSVDVPLSQSSLLDALNESDNNHSFTKTMSCDGLTVLVVDDDPAIVDAMAELLGVFDMDVVTASCGKEALKHIQEGTQPDFILTDYRLPEMNGVELISQLRAATKKSIPVVIMSGDISDQTLEAGKLENCTVLAKPVNIDQLLSLIKPAGA
ncbi:PAS domain-containing hybrid sensor histidine kinase/response regulator [Leucothrix arctica]|uniref:histidine kinase n=1 Tax=Leucothrix arctica TaxID=1481894 RepID=A0A317CCN4_9GAMM|nr:PAS domain S-box protein [Leucothrix arctica]PWQ93852.1 hypothetical protein DKT75_19820 [Leucothrix arctica]